MLSPEEAIDRTLFDQGWPEEVGPKSMIVGVSVSLGERAALLSGVAKAQSKINCTAGYITKLSDPDFLALQMERYKSPDLVARRMLQKQLKLQIFQEAVSKLARVEELIAIEFEPADIEVVKTTIQREIRECFGSESTLKNRTAAVNSLYDGSEV